MREYRPPLNIATGQLDAQDRWPPVALQAITRVWLLSQQVDPSSTISGRLKSSRSANDKAVRLKTCLTGVFDLIGVRVLVDTIERCFLLVSAMHICFPRLEDKYDDYISKPKANGYQSLHTIILDAAGCPIEVQVRTRPMHHCAERGSAAHNAYKTAVDSQ